MGSNRKGISLKEAVENSEFNIKIFELENKIEKEKLLSDVCEKLNKIISINIDKIILNPININFPISGLYIYNNEISEMYSDFKISFSSWDNNVNIALYK